MKYQLFTGHDGIKLMSTTATTAKSLARTWQVFILLMLSASSITAVSETNEKGHIVGAGAHFSWIIFNELKDELEAESGRKIELYGQGSLLGVGCNSGIKNAQKNRPGSESFGFVCCPISDEEMQAQGIIVYPLALEPILTVVNADNPVNNLSTKQVRAIFKGEINNWKEVGGPDKSIIVVARLHCKNRAGHWKTILPSHKQFVEQRLNVTSADEMVEKINSLRYAIGHIGSTWNFKKTDHVKSLSVDGYKPTAKNITSKKYPFFRKLSAVTNKSPSEDVVKIIESAQSSPNFIKLAHKYELLPLTADR